MERRPESTRPRTPNANGIFSELRESLKKRGKTVRVSGERGRQEAFQCSPTDADMNSQRLAVHGACTGLSHMGSKGKCSEGKQT